MRFEPRVTTTTPATPMTRACWLAASLLLATPALADEPVYRDTSRSFEERAAELVSHIGQSTESVPRNQSSS
jgi:hypothetical protein